jgi:hypothetical protein
MIPFTKSEENQYLDLIITTISYVIYIIEILGESRRLLSLGFVYFEIVKKQTLFNKAHFKS